jgi:hypothetical protein
MSTKVKRSQIALFMNTTPSATAASYDRVGDGVTTATMNYNPNTVTEQYIHQDSANTFVESYAPTFPLEQTCVAGDDVFDFIDGLRQGVAVLDAAETDVVEVRLYETPDTAGTSYPATKWNVSVSIDTFGGDGGTSGRINYTLNTIGDPVQGDFNTSTLAFTADT